MNEPDLDNSWIVDGIAWAMYAAWLTLLVGVVMWFGVEPLPSIDAAMGGGTRGTLAALGSGVAFLLASRALYDHLRRRSAAEDDGSEATVDPSTEPPMVAPEPVVKKRKKKKKKKKRR